jgi:hypothetical protein
VWSMKRRMALTFAGTAAIVLTAGSAAVAANLGILGSANQEPVGRLDANSVADLSATTTTTVAPIVVTIDEIVPVEVPDTSPLETSPPPVSGSSTGSSSSSGVSSNRGPSATTSTTARVDDHSGKDGDDHSGTDDDDHSGSGGGGSDHDDD